MSAPNYNDLSENFEIQLKELIVGLFIEKTRTSTCRKVTVAHFTEVLD